MKADSSPAHAPRVLLERELELGALSAALASAQAGRGGIVLVQAATGLGKSRLLEEAAVLGQQAGMNVLRSAGRALERDLAFGVVLQLFEKGAARAAPERRERLFSGSAGLAAPLVLEGRTPPEGLGACLHGLYWLTTNLAEEQPLLLAVDDVHWCDSPTLRFLVYLAQRIDELPVAVVLAAAEGEPRDPDPLLDELRAHPSTTVLRPGPLSPEAVTRCLRDSVLPEAEPQFAAACHEVTGGNPLLLQELGVELAMRAVVPEDPNSAAVREVAPASVASAALVRLRRLGEGAPQLAEAVAVLGDGAQLRHAAELAGLPGERAAELADALMGAGVLRREALLSFVHPVVRAAIYRQRSEHYRAEAHRKAARSLMAEHAPEERVVPHLLAGRPAGDVRAMEILVEAAERALTGGAPASAVRLLRRALEEPPPAARRPAVLLALGRAEGAAGAPEAVERLTGVLDLIGEPQGRAAAALEAGRMLINHARWSEAEQTLSRGLREVDGTDDRLHAQLESTLAAVTRLLPRAEGRAPEVRLDDETLDHTPAGRVLLAQAAFDHALSGTSATQARELAARALGGGALLEEETSDGVGFNLAVFALTIAEDLQAAELAASTAVEDAQRRGSVLGFATACHFRSLAIVKRGRIPAAAADAVNALDARRYGWKLSLGTAVAVRAECDLEHGELAAAARKLEAFADEGHPLDPSAYRYLGVRGHVRLMQLSPQAALDDLLEAGQLQEQFGGGHPAVYPWRSIASAAALALGDRSEARRLAEEELRLAEAFGAPGAIGIAFGALAATMDGGESLEARAEAVRMLESSHLALDRARALVDLGGALRRAGRRREAREPLKWGLDLASRCEALVLVRRAREELVAAGGRPRRDASAGRESLTAREVQVAGLAAQGMSNREIAEALFVTVKTVEWHLKHAYEKLGVGSRSQLRSALVPDQSA